MMDDKVSRRRVVSGKLADAAVINIPVSKEMADHAGLSQHTISLEFGGSLPTSGILRIEGRPQGSSYYVAVAQNLAAFSVAATGAISVPFVGFFDAFRIVYITPVAGATVINAIIHSVGEELVSLGLQGLGPVAAMSVGTTQGTVAAGNDPRFSMSTTFKNRIINSRMEITQRGNYLHSGSGNEFGFGPDRFYGQIYSGNSGGGAVGVSWSQVAFANGVTFPPSNPSFCGRLQATSLGALGTTGAMMRIGQTIEDVRTHAGTTVTFSFYAASDSARNIAVMVNQNFGTGGSSPVQIPNVVAISAGFARYSVTVNLPSVAGKSIGANSCVTCYLYLYSQNADFGVPAVGTWSTSAYLDTYGWQIEPGSVATDLEVLPGYIELSRCHRYYEKSYDMNVAPGAVSAFGLVNPYFTNYSGSGPSSITVPTSFKVVKRITPAVTIYSTGTGATGKARDYASNVDVSASPLNIGQSGFSTTVGMSSVSGNVNLGWQWTADAELT